jgi:hypothetical protein
MTPPVITATAHRHLVGSAYTGNVLDEERNQ